MNAFNKHHIIIFQMFVFNFVIANVITLQVFVCDMYATCLINLLKNIFIIFSQLFGIVISPHRFIHICDKYITYD
ncbi:hypothetical protein V1478_011566 [Vespula squamosa]|uniref:Uncharacterized protein n=1 Tax=Vespula squamosa TaxID=30214 RepID=A0ABD2AEV1_VESSQ